MSISVSIRIIIINNNKILLVNNIRDGFYYLPGGKMELFEDVYETARREIREELGENIEFKFKRILFISDFINKSKDKHKHEIYISGELNDYDNINKNDPEHDGQDEFVWIEIDKLPETLKPEFLKQEISKYLKNPEDYEVAYLINKPEEQN